MQENFSKLLDSRVFETFWLLANCGGITKILEGMFSEKKWARVGKVSWNVLEFAFSKFFRKYKEFVKMFCLTLAKNSYEDQIFPAFPIFRANPAVCSKIGSIQRKEDDKSN